MHNSPVNRFDLWGLVDCTHYLKSRKHVEFTGEYKGGSKHYHLSVYESNLQRAKRDERGRHFRERSGDTKVTRLSTKIYEVDEIEKDVYDMYEKELKEYDTIFFEHGMQNDFADAMLSTAAICYTYKGKPVRGVYHPIEKGSSAYFKEVGSFIIDACTNYERDIVTKVKKHLTILSEKNKNGLDVICHSHGTKILDCASKGMSEDARKKIRCHAIAPPIVLDFESFGRTSNYVNYGDIVAMTQYVLGKTPAENVLFVGDSTYYDPKHKTRSLNDMRNNSYEHSLLDIVYLDKINDIIKDINP